MPLSRELVPRTKRRWIIEKQLVISTAHLSQTDMVWLTANAKLNEENNTDPGTPEVICYNKGEYGYLLYIPFLASTEKKFREWVNSLGNRNPTFQRILWEAKRRDCCWISIDRDGHLCPGLPTYNW